MDLNTQGSEDNMAVVIRNAVKSFDKNEPRVLDELNMSVPKGCIYGLLGASGTGKTTLLTAMLGVLKFDSGEVKVLGVTPGKRGSGIPGALIGYMPQETALVDVFDIKNTFFFFGWVYGMNDHDIVRRKDFLTNLLDLPHESQLIKNLSGGQTRRLSLAVAVMHNPKVLILDEPTVGQDPFLRHSIWNYLVELSEKQNLTIIITTHYIEEARAAHRVGLLRNGKLLVEGSPNHLLAKFNCASLEEVSLLLSQRQTDHSNTRTTSGDQFEMAGPSSLPVENIDYTEEPLDANTFPSSPSTKDDAITLRSTSASRMKAVMYTSWFKFIRNHAGIFFTFGFPVLHFLCFFFCIGGDPTRLPIAIVNEELGNCYQLPGGLANHSSVHLTEDDVCQFTGMSCLYMDMIDTEKVIINYFDTLEKGLQATREGRTFSTLHFQSNFSTALQLRQEQRRQTQNDTVQMSEIKISMDMADYLIARSLQSHYLNKYTLLQEYISDQCQFTKSYISFPMKINEPVYGVNDENYVVSMAPGYIITLVMFMTTAFSSAVVLMEKLEGVWTRNIATGLSSSEMLLSHLVSHTFVMVALIAENVILVFWIFGAYVVGSVWSMILILLIQAICGVALGVLLSVIASTLFEATFFSMATMIPSTIVCGIMWPIEGIPYIIRVICSYLPGMRTSQAFHNILYKGWPVTHPNVYPGFLVPIVWTFIFIILSVIRLRHSST